MIIKTNVFTKFVINTFATQILVNIISIITSILIARQLGPYGKGVLSLVLLIPTISFALGRMGICHAINYYASKENTTKLILNSCVLSLALGVLLFLITPVAIYPLQNVFFKGISQEQIKLACIGIPVYMVYDNLQSVMQGLYKIKERNILIISHPFLNMVFVMVLVVALKKLLDGAIIAWVAALFVAFLISMTFVLKEMNISDLKIDVAIIRKLLIYGLRSQVGNVFKQLSYRGDVLIVNYFLSPAAVGFYMIAVNTAEMLLKIPDAISNVLLPHVAKMDNELAKKFTPNVCRIMLIIVCFGFLFLLAGGKLVIILFFGKEFLPSVKLLYLLLPGILFLALWKIIANDLIARGYPNQYSMTAGLSTIVMIVIDIFLVPMIGVSGAAISSSISYASGTILITYFYIKTSGNSIKDVIMPRPSDLDLVKDILKNKEKSGRKL